MNIWYFQILGMDSGVLGLLRGDLASKETLVMEWRRLFYTFLLYLRDMTWLWCKNLSGWVCQVDIVVSFVISSVVRITILIKRSYWDFAMSLLEYVDVINVLDFAGIGKFAAFNYRLS
jgi:hypothetical protein